MIQNHLIKNNNLIINKYKIQTTHYIHVVSAFNKAPLYMQIINTNFKTFYKNYNNNLYNHNQNMSLQHVNVKAHLVMSINDV